MWRMRRVLCLFISVGFFHMWRSEMYSLGTIIKQFDEAGWSWLENIEEEGEVNHDSQREQQCFHRHARPGEHNHSQHGQQAAVQVILHVWTEGGSRRNMWVQQVRRDLEYFEWNGPISSSSYVTLLAKYLSEM